MNGGIDNIGSGSTDKAGSNAVSVFLLDYGRMGIREDFANAHFGAVKGLVSCYVSYFLDKKGCVPRNWEFESPIGNMLGSFRLHNADNLDSMNQIAYFSQSLGLDLKEIEGVSIINGGNGLSLELYPDSKISIEQLGEAITDYIAKFIKSNNIERNELERLAISREGGELVDIKPKINNPFSEYGKDHKLLFFIQKKVGNRIWFSDLSPINPHFLYLLLKHLDERFGNK